MNLSRMSFVFIVANSNWLDVVSIFLSGMLSVFVLSGMLSVCVVLGMFSVVQCQTSSCRSSVTADLGCSVSHIQLVCVMITNYALGIV